MKIAIIDTDSLLYFACHPNKDLDENSNPRRSEDGKKFLYVDKTEDEVKSSLDSLMTNILSKGRFTHYIGFIKGRNTILSRKAFNPEYKANRTSDPPKHLSLAKVYLKDKWNAVEVNNMESDDACNITRLSVTNSYMCCIDKDLLALEGKHYNWKDDKWIEISSIEADYKFWSDMICGQSGDNIKGIPGKATKYVEKLFEPQIISHSIENIELHTPYYVKVLQAYYDYYKDFELALDEYTKTYKCLKILDKFEGFVIPEPIEYVGRMSLNK